MDGVRILAAGEQGLVVEFANKIEAGINRQVHRLTGLLLQQNQGEIKEIVPTYRSLLVYFDPTLITRKQLIDRVTSLIHAAADDDSGLAVAKVISIPVCYGGEFGPDIAYVAQHNGITEAEVIQIHTSVPYLVYMLGFTPGFPYLGGMSEKIATPRLQKPRTCIPAGSVGIAGSQTGFYPVESPGGWQLIGRTPVKAFNTKADNPFLFAAGDYLQFQPIGVSEYEEIAAKAAAGLYQPVIRDLKVKGGLNS
ncbi:MULTISPECIES: 5-oxoprolinase subunit PxpB [Sporomusa]|jgi:inhibitor of KinA|uniref:5-oxoprolinase subunit PxpB n=1 Tax=Sporomusa TaxID=2375 RepID=UPI002C0F941E|nr:5-oxoprolinase subunit PxpB [Sporomusa sphaeroides]HML34693.1 5-oxoprolinase subunit PxpB [Sporomusa sphaeroides]